jgi:hypothetical protein
MSSEETKTKSKANFFPKEKNVMKERKELEKKLKRTKKKFLFPAKRYSKMVRQISLDNFSLLAVSSNSTAYLPTHVITTITVPT